MVHLHQFTCERVRDGTPARARRADDEHERPPSRSPAFTRACDLFSDTYWGRHSMSATELADDVIDTMADILLDSLERRR